MYFLKARWVIHSVVNMWNTSWSPRSSAVPFSGVWAAVVVHRSELQMGGTVVVLASWLAAAEGSGCQGLELFWWWTYSWYPGLLPRLPCSLQRWMDVGRAGSSSGSLKTERRETSQPAFFLFNSKKWPSFSPNKTPQPSWDGQRYKN